MKAALHRVWQRFETKWAIEPLPRSATVVKARLPFSSVLYSQNRRRRHSSARKKLHAKAWGVRRDEPTSSAYLTAFAHDHDSPDDDSTLGEGQVTKVSVRAHASASEDGIGPVVEVRVYTDGPLIVHLMMAAEAAADLIRRLAEAAAESDEA
jgi:hypothetical protein